MALVRATQPLPFSWSFVDNNGKPSSAGLYLPSGTVTGGIDTFAAGTRTEIIALTNAQLVGATASYVYVEDAPIVAPAESEVERKLVMSFNTSVRGVYVTLELPSPVFSIETRNTDEVDILNPLVAALGTAIVNGALGPGNGPVTRSGGQITSLRRAYISHRYRKPRS